MKTKTQLFLGNGIILLLMMGVSFILYKSIKSLIQTSYWVGHTYQAINNGNSLMTYMVDQETGMRGFLVTGNEEYLEPYISGKSAFNELITKTQELVSDNPTQVKD